MPTIKQVVHSSYGWANGDLALGTIQPVAHCTTPAWSHDGLLRFLLTETAPDGHTTNSPEHWRQARQRIDQALEEVLSVRQALHTRGPQCPN